MGHSLYCLRIKADRSGESIDKRVEIAKGLLSKRLMSGAIGVAQILLPGGMATGRVVGDKVVWRASVFEDIPAID